MMRDNRHDSVYLFGALCPIARLGAAIIMPAANSEAMSVHLKEISAQVSPDAHAVLVCDGAGWHQRGDKLTVPDNITLLPLPAYSPELNPMENVWDYLRGNKLSHTVWDTYEAIVQACATPLRLSGLGMGQSLGALVLDGLLMEPGGVECHSGALPTELWPRPIPYSCAPAPTAAPAAA